MKVFVWKYLTEASRLATQQPGGVNQWDLMIRTCVSELVQVFGGKTLLGTNAGFLLLGHNFPRLWHLKETFSVERKSPMRNVEHLFTPPHVNTLILRQNCRHFAYDIFKCIFLDENVWTSLKISLKFLGSNLQNSSIVSYNALAPSRRKPLSEPMIVNLLTHICVTRP